MSFCESVVSKFRESVSNAYDLESSVIDSLCKIVEESITEVGVPAGRGRARKTPTTRRKKSGYNVFVRKMMSDDDDIKQLGHREKMAAIGARWKALNDEDKLKYNDLAKEENDTTAEVHEEVEEEEVA